MKPGTFEWNRVIACVGVLTTISALIARGEVVPSFDLPRWKTGERVRLEDFGGGILVLDFFAYWCAPCEEASRELEKGVQEFYAARKGNLYGVPVRVLAVNIERDLPERTEEYLRKTGVSFVVNDVSGTVLKQLGGTGIPFLVIIDGTHSRPGEPSFEIIYKHAGFEGLRKTRQIIDGVKRGADSKANTDQRERVRSPTEVKVTGAPLRQTIEADTEMTWAWDILLTDTKLLYREERGRTEWDTSFSYASFDEDYRPLKLIDNLGFREHLHEDRFSGQLDLRQRLQDQFTILGTGGIYDGYPDYRRVWIANRYRQKYEDLPYLPAPGYSKPEPKGWNVSGGARWEYLPSTGFAELKLGYAFEQTAPGYADSTDTNLNYILLRGRERLDTETLTFSTENILTKRIRALNELTVTQVTDRELRYAYQGSLNLALGERWVMRGYGGFATEKPRFDAYFFGLTLEYELISDLLLSLTGRYYKDTGEVVNGLPFTSAAPPLVSWEVGIGLRYSWGRSSLKVYAGPFWTDYNRKNDAPEFTYLYSDRKWVLAQIAYSLQF